MEFVVNEWLPEYFKPEAPIEEKRKLKRFLNRFHEKGDKIFVRRTSPFLNKIYKFSKDYQNYHDTFLQLTDFFKLVLLDSEKCFFVDDDDFELSDLIRKKLIETGNYVSDTYLFEAASLTDSKLIITTDERLQAFMKNEPSFKIVLLDDFLLTY